jgi:hypothetical protein
MKTAMQELIDEIKLIESYPMNPLLLRIATDLLEKEKEQIVQAFKTGYNVTEYDADDYFDLLYNQNK